MNRRAGNARTCSPFVCLWPSPPRCGRKVEASTLDAISPTPMMSTSRNVSKSQRNCENSHKKAQKAAEEPFNLLCLFVAPLSIHIVVTFSVSKGTIVCRQNRYYSIFSAGHPSLHSSSSPFLSNHSKMQDSLS